MVNKGRKLLALLTMLALIFTYSFSASGLSVYAEEEQGDTNAKAVATEDKAPAAPKEEKAEEPAPAPAPAPAEEVGETGGSEPAANNDQEVKEEGNEEGEVLEEDPDAVLEEVLEEEAAVKAPPTPHQRPVNINYDRDGTLDPFNDMHPGTGEVEHWEFSGAEGCYTWNENTLTIHNKNKTTQQQTLIVTHTINRVGTSGYSRGEYWTVNLRSTSRVTINYYSVNNESVHQDVAVGPDEYNYYSVWGIPEREGFIFLGWATRPGSENVAYRPNDSINFGDYARTHPGFFNNQQATFELYAVWTRDTVDLGSVTGKSDTVPYNSREQVLYGIEEGSDDGGYSLFKTLERPHGAQTYYNYYYVKTNDVYAKGKEVGDYETAVSYARVYLKDTSISGGIHATSMYVKVNPGTLTIIDEFNGEVTANSKTVAYTGQEQAVYGITANPDQESGYVVFKSNQYTLWAVKAEDIYAKGTDVGEYTTEVEYAEVFSKANNQGSSSYSSTGKYVKVIPGTLTIAETFNGEVTANSKELPYNGAEQAVYGITADPDQESGYVVFKSNQYTLWAVKAEDIYAKGTDAGEYATEVEYAEVFSKANMPGSGDFSSIGKFVKVIPGKLTITPRPVTIEVTVTKNGEPVVTKPYTSEQYNVVFDVPSLTTADEILSSEWDPSWAGQRHDLWVEGTDAGEYYTKVDDTLDDYDLGENVNPDNYEITIEVTQGTLKIEAADMKFTVKNYDAVYDGEYHTVTVNTRDLPEGYKLLYSKTGSETEKWTEEAPTWKDVELENTRPGGPVSHPVYVKAICKNFNPVVVEGTVTIRPRPVEVNVDVTSNGESTVTRTYNEQWQSLWFSDIYYDTEDEVLDSEWDPYFSGGGNEYLAKGKEVGEYDTHVKAVATSHTLGGDALAVNYDVTFNVTQGTLVIEAAPMPKFDVTPYDGVFDNEAHTVTVDTSTLPDGFELSYSKTGSETEKWTKDAPEWTYVELTDVRPGGPVSHPVYVKATCDGYKPLIVKSYVKISPREVTVNVERLYNGQNVVEIPFDNESHSYIFDEVSYTTDDEVLDSMKEFKPSYSRKDYKITNKKDVGEYETDVQSEASYYSLMSDRDLNVNFIPTYVVKQGKLIIYAEPATLTFKLNGGNVDGDTEDIVIETETGQTVVIPDAPTKDGYEFQYWKGSKVYPGDEYLVTGDHEFNAIWAKKGSGGGDSDDSDSDGSSTGDTFGLLALFATMSAALLGLLALVVTRRREE